MSAALERDELARQLITDPALRHEVTRIAQGIRNGKPSDTYIVWKHSVNELARQKRIDPAEMLTAVVMRAIDLNMP